jgi:hypothetical protein
MTQDPRPKFDVVVTITSESDLSKDAHICGKSVGHYQGKQVFQATWSGIYVGVVTPEDMPNTPYHYFRDGEVNGNPQSLFGFPVYQVVRG